MQTVRAESGFAGPIALPAAPVRPVFVVGMNGSGTTMLAESLGRHPALFSLARETRVIPHLIRVARRYGPLEDDRRFFALWERVRRIHVFVKRNRGQPVPIPCNWAEFPRSLSAVLDANYRYFAAQHGKARWCEKSPQYVQHMPDLLELFPEARFVHIIRDGRACAASFHRRWQRHTGLAMYRWCKVLELADACAPALGPHYLEVRYEDVVADPYVWMRRICAHVDLPFTDAVLGSSQPQSAKSGEPGRIHDGNIARWRSELGADELHALESIGGCWLARKGYPVDPPGDARYPNPGRLMVWRASDNLRSVLALLARIAGNYTPGRARRLLRRLSVGWWHAWTNKY